MSVDVNSPPNLHSDFLFHALMRAHFNARQAGLSQQALPNLGSPLILFVLGDLEDQGAPAPSQKELADILHISPATVATSLKSMEREGFIGRKTDERDSRRNRISLTEQGRQALFTSRQVFLHVDEYMFHGFSEEERRLVYQLHLRMLQNLYQIGGNQDFAPPPPPPPPYRK